MKKPDIWFNGEFVPYEEANIHVLSHVVHYGSSVFEGIRCYNTDEGSAIFRLEEHMKRLVDSAKVHRMETQYSVDELCDAVVDTVERSGMESCYIRPVTFRGMGPMGVNPLQNKVETFIAVWEWGTYLGDEALEEGVDVEVANWNRMAPNTLPAMAKAGGNYLNASLVKMNALKNGMHEGIMLNTNGYLAEGSGENLFIVRDGEIYTAPVGLSILPGITRDSIITLAREKGYSIEEKMVPREALYIADELFFTGTAAEVTPIRSVDHYTVGDGVRGEITEDLQSAYFDIVHNGNDPHDWLTFVDVEEPEEAAATM
ncbi:branched chain amino acid aminotransferase [Longibacter salinarum]|uniref:Branched-chain-amino-acid aminotransferase n=1 Tax=Longibacter salinarum TaxID=1850348 RepID=A0A2A8CYF8_9BACT|nr:branched-chain amino acid transaminase [Longibacter salinarum]PEN13686.1 branched chain amino acid aminotransferase [Longibacter salinarum]